MNTSLSKNRDYRSILSNVNNKIQKGLFKEAQTELLDHLSTDIPRDHLVSFADLLRRVGQFREGLKLLNPIVRPDRPLNISPTLNEQAVYAALLIKIGAISEAQKILKTIVSPDLPKTYLFLSFTYIRQWRYKSAIPILKRYTQCSSLTEYEILVGKLNLAASYVAASLFDQATETVDVLLTAAQSMKNKKLLQANSFELLAQIAVIKGQREEAKYLLSKAQASMGSGASNYEFYIRKWNAIVDMQEDPCEKNKSKLIQLKEEAFRRKEWETARECDFYLSIATLNKSLFSHVYHGTPFKAYRDKMTKEWPNSISVPREYLLNQSLVSTRSTLCLKTGLDDKGNEILQLGSRPYKLFLSLCKDFYYPQSVGQVFLEVYPDEYFDPINSEHRLSTVTYRLRSIFKEKKIPIDVLVKDGQYSLTWKGPYNIILHKTNNKIWSTSDEKKEHQLNQLKKKWDYKAFTSGQAAEHLGVSKKRIYNLLKWALSINKIHSSGKGRSLIYHFKK